jgi:hypothetical protein
MYRMKLSQEYTVMYSAAPAEALDTAEVRSHELREQVTTPSAPRKYALRNIAPKFLAGSGQQP